MPVGRRFPHHQPLPVWRPGHGLRIHRLRRPRLLHLPRDGMVYAHEIFPIEPRQDRQVLRPRPRRVAAAHRRRLVKLGIRDLDRRRGGEVEDAELQARRRAEQDLAVARAEARNVGLFPGEQRAADGGVEGRVGAGGKDVHALAGADEQPRRRR